MVNLSPFVVLFPELLAVLFASLFARRVEFSKLLFRGQWRRLWQ